MSEEESLTEFNSRYNKERAERWDRQNTYREAISSQYNLKRRLEDIDNGRNVTQADIDNRADIQRRLNEASRKKRELEDRPDGPYS